MNEKLLNMSSSPHIRHRLTTGAVMTDVVLALLPAAVFGIYRYGIHAFLILLISVASAVATEFLYDKAARKPMTVKDGGAVVTGLLPGRTSLPSVSWIRLRNSVCQMLFRRTRQELHEPGSDRTLLFADLLRKCHDKFLCRRHEFCYPACRTACR